MYIPNELSETMTIKVNIHIMQKSESEPDNYTVDDIGFLTELVNIDLNNLLSASNVSETCQKNSVSGNPVSVDSKMRLVLGQIFFHVDPIGWKNNQGEQDINEDGSLKYNTFNGNPVIVTDGNTSDYCRITYLNNSNLGDDALNIFFVEPTGDHYAGWGPGYDSELENHIIMSRAWSKKGTDWWEIDGLILHEIGHCLGLLHSWCDSQKSLFNYECSHNIWNVNNHMMSYNVFQNYLPPLTVGHMRRLLQTSWREKELVQTPMKNETYFFEEDYILEISKNIDWVGNIVVKNGVTLTINGLLQMHNGRTITVERGAKLIVDGGKISSCEGEQWGGIYLQGYSDLAQPLLNDPFPLNKAGIVHLTNSAVIENAHNGIMTYDKNISWSNGSSDYYGGLIVADNGATFRNCHRAVAFKKYLIHNNSRFIDVKFENCEYGVTIWKCENIKFEKCTFEDIPNDAIHGIDMEIRITSGNNFINCGYGVRSLATSTGTQRFDIGGAEFQPNTFTDCDYGVYLSHASSGFGNAVIENNSFVNNDNDIYLYGDNSFDINTNDFVGASKKSIYIVSSMDNLNEVNCNYFDNNFADFVCQYNNEWTTFESNDFGLNDPFNFVISGEQNKEGEIDFYQGSASKPAANCFGTTHLQIYEDGAIEDFQYYTPDRATFSGVPECWYPNYINTKALSETNDVCDNVIGSGVLSKPQVDAIISHYCDLLRAASLHPRDSLIQQAVESYQAYYYRNVDKYLQSLSRSGSRDSIVDLLSTMCDPKAQKRLFGIYIKKGDCARADSMLSIMANNVPQDTTFLAVQAINVKNCLAEDRHILTVDERALLQSVATAADGESGSAQALLYQMTGEWVIEDQLELNTSIPFQSPGNGATGSQDALWSTYPNPVDDEFNIDFSGEILADWNLSLYNLLGQRVIVQPYDNSHTRLKTDKLQIATYLLVVTDNTGNIVYNTKVVKQ